LKSVRLILLVKLSAYRWLKLWGLASVAEIEAKSFNPATG